MEIKHLRKEAATRWISRITVKDAFTCAGIITTGLVLFAMRHYLFLIALILINAFSSALLKNLRRNQIGVEMVMFSTVMSGAVYGPVVGAVMGATAMITDYVFATRFSLFSVVTIPSYAVVGALSPLMFNFMGITALGIALTIAYAAFSNTIICGFMGGHINKSIRFAMTNTAFNIFMFTAVAPAVMRIVA